jgi:hypothetical protein
MSVVTLEGIVEGGQVRLPSNVRLPDSTRVFVVVPDVQVERVAQVISPRPARPDQASDFAMEIVGDEPDAGVRSHPI